jgi:hypothetical protein
MTNFESLMRETSLTDLNGLPVYLYDKLRFDLGYPSGMRYKEEGGNVVQELLMCIARRPATSSFGRDIAWAYMLVKSSVRNKKLHEHMTDQALCRIDKMAREYKWLHRPLAHNLPFKWLAQLPKRWGGLRDADYGLYDNCIEQDKTLSFRQETRRHSAEIDRKLDYLHWCMHELFTQIKNNNDGDHYNNNDDADEILSQ